VLILIHKKLRVFDYSTQYRTKSKFQTRQQRIYIIRKHAKSDKLECQSEIDGWLAFDLVHGVDLLDGLGFHASLRLTELPVALSKAYHTQLRWNLRYRVISELSFCKDIRTRQTVCVRAISTIGVHAAFDLDAVLRRCAYNRLPTNTSRSPSKLARNLVNFVTRCHQSVAMIHLSFLHNPIFPLNLVDEFHTQSYKRTVV
jgi:hypothetical protein